jgi:hypothetical protein
MLGGLRYVRHSPAIRRVLVRTFLVSVGGGAVYSMMPLVARLLLDGGAGTYGIMLGAFGVGAVLAAVSIGTMRKRFSNDQAALIGVIGMGLALLIMAVSRSPLLTACGTLIAGAGWISKMSLFNVSVQLTVPRWVGGRALSTFQASCAAGLAGGAWMWGNIAQNLGVEFTLFAAFGWLMFVALISNWLPLPDSREEFISAPSSTGEPVVELDITGRSGPIIIEIEHNVPPEFAREFYHIAIQVQRSRERDGAFGVSIARDIENPAFWMERFHFPTWHDYLRWRDRPTIADRKLRDQLSALRIDQKPPRIRRMLERPFGSVRWRDEAPDYGRRSGNSDDFIV